jgi:hypothetical protein
MNGIIDGKRFNMTIKVYDQLSLMIGIGEEWLTDLDGNVRAVFIDGNLRCQVYQLINTQDITLITESAC